MKKTLLSHLFCNTRWVVAVCLLALLAGVFAETTPFLQSIIINDGILNSSQQVVLCACVVIFFVLALDVVAGLFLGLTLNQMGFSVAKKMRTTFFENIISNPLQFFKEKRSGDVVYRANIYIFSVGNFVSKNVYDFLIGITRFLIIFVYLFVLNFKFALVLSGLYLIAIIFAILHARTTYNTGKKYKELELHRNSLLLQNLDNVETFLAYNDNFEYLPRYNNINMKYRKVRGRFHLQKHLFLPITDFLISLGTVIIYLLTYKQTLGAVEVGVVVALLTYANRMISPIQLISDCVAESMVIGANINKITTPQTIKKTKTTSFKSKSVDIVCKNITFFSKTQSCNFQNLNLKIAPSSHIALIGNYGSGKTDFAEILAGLQKDFQGKVLFNGIDTKKIDNKDLCNTISIASDEVHIFEGSFYDNVKMARPTATKNQIEKALKLSGLTAQTKNFSKGVHTVVGKNISEGDKQLVAFARVILKDTPVVIFDEFTRDLGTTHKQQFFKTLSTWGKNKTIIFLCQKAPNDFKFDKKILFSKIHE